MKNTQQQIKLRAYQATDIDAIETAWKEFRSILYQLPTGGGKSVVLSKIIGDYRNENIIIFAHKRRLLMQMKAHLQKIGITPGLLFAATDENMDSNICIVSIRTAVKSKRLEKLMLRKWDRVIIDEARHSRTGSYDIVLDRFLQDYPKHKLLGVDATPYRNDKKRLDKFYQTLVTSCEDIQSLQEKGFLAKERIFATPIGEIEKQVKQLMNGDYQQTELSNYMRQQKYLDYVVDAYTKWGENRQAIVFAVDKAHSADLLNTFKKKGYKSVKLINSDLSPEEVDEIYKEYEDKKLQIIINVEMLTEGIDLPETGCIVGARPTKSLVLYLQMVGRGTRPKEDGSDLIIVDCAGWTEEYGGPSSKRQWSLDPEVDPNDPRKKNRVVGKKANGELTADLTEMAEFTELIEMTPDEYIAKVKDGIKSAEKQNLSIDEKIKKVQDDLAELLHKAALEGLKGKVSPFCCLMETNWDDKLTACFLHKSRVTKKAKRRGTEEVDSWMDGTHVVKMELEAREKMYAYLETRELESYGGRQNKESLKQYREMAQVCGQVNSMIMDNKNLMMQILEKHQTIHDLKATKINIEEYKNLEEKIKKDTWKLSVDQHLSKSKTFKFDHPLTMDNYFPKSMGYGKKIVGVTVQTDNINVWNKLLILLTDRWNTNEKPTVEEKMVAKEKVYELIETGEWKPE